MILNDMLTLCYYYDRKRDGHFSPLHISDNPPRGGTRQSGAVVARKVHTLEVTGSSPVSATSELLT